MTNSKKTGKDTYYLNSANIHRTIYLETRPIFTWKTGIKVCKHNSRSYKTLAFSLHDLCNNIISEIVLMVTRKSSKNQHKRC